ncbi:hypothetical protein [Kitasatospora camelliae]|uniref:DUF3592 domain-containing protein n=1 Tax=Kitasatospora camelliae TaxID=3156397 RepID=A0AAU8JN31_9ACTN
MARVLGVVLCLLAAGVVWLFGMMSGFETRPTRACVTELYGWDPVAYRAPEHENIRIEESLFPPSSVCRWPDGRSVELVPWWNAPLLFGALGGAVALPAYPPVRRAVVRRRASRQDHNTPASRAVHTEG